MDEPTKRPNAALINREWYESAKGVLGARDLSCVVIAAIEYVLYGDTAIALQDSARVVFAMIRPALDSDIAKYSERCSRNAANARCQRQRVEASGSESHRVAANTTPTSNTTPKSISTTSPSLSSEVSEERERWLIFGYFWSIGSNAIVQECEAFWSYYESLGWRNNKGAAIMNKLACARMWKRQFETRPAPNGADAWFKVMQACQIHDTSLFTAYMGAERVESGAVVRLRCSEQWLADFKAKCGHILPALCKLWRTPAVTIERLQP